MSIDDEYVPLSDEGVCALMRDTAETLIRDGFAELRRLSGGGPWTAATEALIRGGGEILFDSAIRAEKVARLMGAVSQDALDFVQQTMRPVFIEALVACARERWLAWQSTTN